MDTKIKEYFSYSKISTYLQCPFKFKLIYRDKLYLFSNNIATAFGSLLHKTEETIGNLILNNKEINYRELIKEFKNKLKEIEIEYPEDFYKKDKNGLTYFDKGTSYINYGIYRLENYLKENKNIKILGLEVEFKMKLNDYQISGSIDRLLFDNKNNIYIIQDIKTYDKEVSKKDLNSPLQFLIYSLAINDLYGDVNIKCQYDLPLLNKLQNCIMDFDSGYKVLCSALNSIDSNQFTPNPSPLCHWCPFCKTSDNQPEIAKNKCFYYSLWTRDNKTKDVANEWKGMEEYEKLLSTIVENEIKIN